MSSGKRWGGAGIGMEPDSSQLGAGVLCAEASVLVIFSTSPPPVWPGGAPVGCSTKSLGGRYYPLNSSDHAHLLGITQAILRIQRVQVDNFFFLKLS